MWKVAAKNGGKRAQKAPSFHVHVSVFSFISSRTSASWVEACCCFHKVGSPSFTAASVNTCCKKACQVFTPSPLSLHGCTLKIFPPLHHSIARRSFRQVAVAQNFHRWLPAAIFHRDLSCITALMSW